MSLEKVTKQFLISWDSSKMQWEPLSTNQENLEKQGTVPGVAVLPKLLQV